MITFLIMYSSLCPSSFLFRPCLCGNIISIRNLTETSDLSKSSPQVRLLLPSTLVPSTSSIRSPIGGSTACVPTTSADGLCSQLFLRTFSYQIYIHPYINAYKHIHTYIHTYMHTYIHTYIYAHTYMHACIHTYIHTYIHAYIHTCIQTYIYA